MHRRDGKQIKNELILLLRIWRISYNKLVSSLSCARLNSTRVTTYSPYHINRLKFHSLSNIKRTNIFSTLARILRVWDEPVRTEYGCVPLICLSFYIFHFGSCLLFSQHIIIRKLNELTKLFVIWFFIEFATTTILSSAPKIFHISMAIILVRVFVNQIHDFN